MTRQDFELIATTLRNALGDAEYPQAHAAQSWRGVEATAYKFADTLDRHNVRFDKARFLRACGLEA